MPNMAKSKVIGDKTSLYKRVKRFISKHMTTDTPKNTIQTNIRVTTTCKVISPLKRFNQLQAINSIQHEKD